MKKLLFLVLFLGVFAKHSNANFENAGLLLGYSLPVGGDETLSSRFAFGLEGSYAWDPDWSIAAGVGFSSGTQDDDFYARFIPISLQLNYQLRNVLPGLYAGPNVGFLLTSYSSETFPAWDGSSFDFHFGGQAGYDYMIMENFSAGAKFEAYYVYFLHDFIDHSFFVNVFLTARYWF